MSGKNNKDSYAATVKVSTITTLMIISGLAMMIIANCLNSNNAVWTKTLVVVDGMGSTLFSAGLVSVIVEISTIRSLVTDAFEKLLKGNIPFDSLSEESLLNLNKKIASSLSGVSIAKIDNTIYKYEHNLLDLVNGKHYEYHKITYHITPDERNGCIHIKTKINYKMVNNRGYGKDNDNDNAFEVRLKLYKLKGDLTVEECLEKLDITEVVINKKKINVTDITSAEPVTHNTESTYYDYKIRLYKELVEPINTITAEFSYDIPLHDKCQTFKISAPCKTLEHKFYIEPDISTGERWIIRANAFSTFFHRQHEECSNYNVEQNVDTSLIIRYNDWALVGNGYCVVYQKEKERS